MSIFCTLFVWRQECVTLCKKICTIILGLFIYTPTYCIVYLIECIKLIFQIFFNLLRLNFSNLKIKNDF